MFEQSLLENVVRGGWKKALAVVISTTFQVSLLMILVVMPLIFPNSMPAMAEAAKTWIFVPQPPHPRPIDDRPQARRPPSGSSLFHPLIDNAGRIDAPTTVPEKVDDRPDEIAPFDPFGVNFLVPGNGHNPNAVAIPGMPTGPAPPPPGPGPRPREKQPTADPIPVGTLDPAKVVNRVQPIYPPLARQARIQGTVVLEAIIGKTGRLEHLRVLSGHPLLVPAARDAVSQWRYRPTILDGEPVEIITTIEVNFTLSQ
jgi:protein TonB